MERIIAAPENTRQKPSEIVEGIRNPVEIVLLSGQLTKYIIKMFWAMDSSCPSTDELE